jgi:predicted RNase H-like HicB family nuclease
MRHILSYRGRLRSSNAEVTAEIWGAQATSRNQLEIPARNYSDFGRWKLQYARESRYSIVLHKSNEGYAVSCPALPGCWSQGATEEEALENIRDSIREYLAAIKETLPAANVREVEVTV